MKIRFNYQNISIISIAKVYPNPWNPKQEDSKEYQRIKKGIELKGLRLPIIVRQKEYGYEIIDGEQRWRACKELGYTEILTYEEVCETDQEAQSLTILYQQQVPFVEIDLAYIIRDLADTKGLSNLELPYSNKELLDYINLCSFDWIQNDKKDKIKTIKLKEIFGFDSIRYEGEVEILIKDTIDKLIKKHGKIKFFIEWIRETREKLL